MEQIPPGSVEGEQVEGFMEEMWFLLIQVQGTEVFLENVEKNNVGFRMN